MMKRAALPLALLLILAACGTGGESPDVLPTRVTIEYETPTPETAEVASAGNQLRFWEPASGQLDPAVPDLWRFTAEAQDEISVRVQGVDALLTLRGEQGQALASGESIRATLPRAGRYTVIVEAGGGSGGGYEIGLGYTDRPNPNETPGTRVPEVVGIPTPTPAYSGLGSFIRQLDGDETVGGTLTDADTPHIYTFEGEAGTYTRVELRYVNGEIDPRVTLYNPDGLPIATDDDSLGGKSAVLRDVLLPTDGLYSVQAAGDAPGGYAVRVQRGTSRASVTPTQVTLPTSTPFPTFSVPTAAPAVRGNRLEAHRPVQDTMTSPGAVTIYPFYATVGEVFTVGARPLDGSDVQLRLEISDPDGGLVARATTADTDSNDVVVSPVRADTEGVYQVYLTAVNNSTGGYIVGYGNGGTWRDSPQPRPERDVQHQAVIAELGVRHVWPVELNAGDIITAGATPATPALDPVLELVAADEPGSVLAIDDNGGGDRAALIQRVTIPRDGIYLLRVRGSRITTGPYTLVWRYVNVAPTPTVPPATYPVLSVDASVEQGRYAFYPFQGFAGQRVSISVTADSEGFDPVFALLAPDGSLIAEVDDTDGSLNPSRTFELSADGTYKVRVNGYLSSGAYTLMVDELFPGGG